jgi:hypothetical protein
MQEVGNQCGDNYMLVRIGSTADKSGHSIIKLGQEEGTVFSIIKSPESTEEGEALQSTIAANEKSLSDQRDLSSTADGWSELIHMFNDSEIKPAQEYLTEGGVIQRVVRDRGFAQVSTRVAAVKSSAVSKSVKKGKETTAAAFFGATANKKSDKKPAASKEVKGKENNKTIDSKAASKKKAEAKPKKDEDIPPKQSANVDDFMGDEDEDEEFMQQESERQARVAREASIKEVRASVTNDNAKKNNTSLNDKRKTNPEKSVKEDSDVELDEKKTSDNEIEYDDCVKKPMDAFAKRATSSSSGGAKKRRKKLVEKTVMENGYLKTVTEEIWEEYEEEEEAKPAAVKAAASKGGSSKPAAKKSGLNKGKKQGSLMGFFSKK